MALEKESKTKISKWKHEGMTVIVLQCKEQIQLFGMMQYLKQWGVINHLYIDEGLTEVDMGTPTALATGILTEEESWIFNTLKLFK